MSSANFLKLLLLTNPKKKNKQKKCNFLKKSVNTSIHQIFLIVGSLSNFQ